MASRPKILLCDDSRALRMVTGQQVTECGFDLAGEASNGRAAVDQYKALRPDVVLLDLVMPELSGQEALAEIMSFDPEAKVVVLSSLGALHDIEECLRIGARSYLQKPIDPEHLARVLHELTD